MLTLSNPLSSQNIQTLDNPKNNTNKSNTLKTQDQHKTQILTIQETYNSLI